MQGMVVIFYFLMGFFSSGGGTGLFFLSPRPVRYLVLPHFLGISFRIWSASRLSSDGSLSLAASLSSLGLEYLALGFSTSLSAFSMVFWNL
jgi:hypothetical protein